MEGLVDIEQNDNVLQILPYHLDPLTTSNDGELSDSDIESCGDNGDIIPDTQHERIGNTEW